MNSLLENCTQVIQMVQIAQEHPIGTLISMTVGVGAVLLICIYYVL